VLCRSLRKAETERDDAVQKIAELVEQCKTLGAAAERVSGLESAVDDLNNKMVRSPCLILSALSPAPV
jgi:hypothetical protein